MSDVAVFIVKYIMELSVATAACIVLVRLFEFLLSRSSARAKYFLWCIVLVRLWIPWTVATPFNVTAFFNWFFSANAAHENQLQENLAGADRNVPDLPGQHAGPGLLNSASHASVSDRDKEGARDFSEKIAVSAASGYLIVVLLLAGGCTVRTIVLTGKVKKLPAIIDPEIRALFTRIKKEMKVNQKISLCYNEINAISVSVGFI